MHAEPRFDRFDIAQAWWLLAHDFGRYRRVTQLRKMLRFLPGPFVERYAELTENGKAIYDLHAPGLRRQGGGHVP